MVTTIQIRFEKEIKLRKPYSYGPYNKVRGNQQRIRITEGCPHNCPYCYEPTEIKIFGIPEIVRNFVTIIDMNPLCKPEMLGIIKDLGERRVNGKVVYYEFMCGIDHRFLTQEIANALKESRFKRIRLAWDWYYEDQFKIKKVIEQLYRAGFKSSDLMFFMITNWRISFEECTNKLDVCKVWRIKVADCYFDGQVMPYVIPIYWTMQEIETFRKKVRKHNQLVNFGIDPEVLMKH